MLPGENLFFWKKYLQSLQPLGTCDVILFIVASVEGQGGLRRRFTDRQLFITAQLW